jgi:hypothetical protein
MSDFPAAHSMDTTWFAVDADGCVGVFDSGEGGAVPRTNRNTQIEGSEEILLTLAELDPQRIIRVQASAKILAKTLTKNKLEAEIESYQSFWQHSRDASQVEVAQRLYNLFLLTSEDITSHFDLADEDGVFLIQFIDQPAVFPQVIYINECSLATIQRLIATGQILGGREFDDINYLLSQLGFFVYEVPVQAPIPYRRCGRTLQPLKLQDLSPDLKDSIHWNSLTHLKFGEHRQIQPIEFTPCNTWNGEWWQDTQGQRHEQFPPYADDCD